MRIANCKSRSLVQNKEPFRGSNLFAEYVGNVYVVYSYGHHWPLFVFNSVQWFENKERYSNSTSRHRSYAHPGVQTTLVSCAELKAMI